MENQRLLLYITLFFIIYLLWAEWQMDYGPKTEAPVSETVSAVEPGATEVPEAATAPDEATIIESSQAEQTGSQRIRVITDVFDIEIDRKDVEDMIETIKAISPTFGGINLEDIKAPECFEVERRLRERLNIPVFHDDQHGTAIVVCAAILNGLRLVGKAMEEVRLVTAGAGAAALAIFVPGEGGIWAAAPLSIFVLTFRQYRPWRQIGDRRRALGYDPPHTCPQQGCIRRHVARILLQVLQDTLEQAAPEPLLRCRASTAADSPGGALYVA